MYKFFGPPYLREYRAADFLPANQLGGCCGGFIFARSGHAGFPVEAWQIG